MTTDHGSTAGVDPADDGAWLEQAAAVLRRGRPDITADGVLDVLERRTVENLRVPVLGTARRAGPARDPLTDRAVGWGIRSLVVVPEHGRPEVVRDLMEQELDGGAGSLWLRWPGPHPEIDLRDVPLDRGPVVLDCDDIVSAAGALVVAAVGREPLSADTVCGVDPFAAAARGATPVPGIAVVRDTVGRIADLAGGLGARALAVDGSAAHDVGAGDAAELGWALAVSADLLRALESSGHPPADAFGLLELRLAATVQQYPTLAKMRAARLVWARLAELCGATGVVLRLHAITSRAMLTRHDAETNQLRTTVAAFAAGVGGADAVTVLPYDAARGTPSRSPRRWARSISLLLQAESHVARTTDPAAGAFALEELTDRLAAAAWAEFGRIEASGGAGAALADGSVRQRWAATAAERARRIAVREQAVIGVSVHPPVPGTSDAVTAGGVDVADGLGWTGIRPWAADFETLQDHPAAAAVVVVPLGSAAAHQSAVGFAVDVFTAGGIPTTGLPTPPGGSAIGDLVRAFADIGGAVACLAGPIEPAVAAELIEGLRRAGARWIIAAAGTAPGVAGVDDRVERGDDVVGFLRRTRDRLDRPHGSPAPDGGVRSTQGAPR